MKSGYLLLAGIIVGAAGVLGATVAVRDAARRIMTPDELETCRQSFSVVLAGVCLVAVAVNVPAGKEKP